MPLAGHGKEATAFVYERDAPAFVGDFVKASTRAATSRARVSARSDSARLSALAEELSALMHMRLLSLLTMGDEW